MDLLIVGAGPVGCVVAERAATLAGWTSLIVEKRDHIAGNCYDRFHESGVLIHQYGPHYFRTGNEALLKYLSRFTEWIPGEYIVRAEHEGELYPLPINLTTLEKFFKRTFTEAQAFEFLEEKRLKIAEPNNSEEFVLSRVGRELYEAFYLGYTLKQWDRHPKDLDVSVSARVPIRLDRDNRYVNEKFQVMPKEGFTRMFERMIAHPNISIRLKTPFSEVRDKVVPRMATVYCGPIDEYFGSRLGKLPWRSLEFDFKTFEMELRQPCVQINYPNERLYTRTIEIKHVTKQKFPRTVVSYEYPTGEGEPYYPVPTAENHQLYRAYEALAEEETRLKKVYFAGRLAQYRYMNTDQAIESALALFDLIQLEAADLWAKPSGPEAERVRPVRFS